jgi:hypothetical protein
MLTHEGWGHEDASIGVVIGVQMVVVVVAAVHWVFLRRRRSREVVVEFVEVAVRPHVAAVAASPARIHGGTLTGTPPMPPFYSPVPVSYGPFIPRSPLLLVLVLERWELLRRRADSLLTGTDKEKALLSFHFTVGFLGSL